MPHFEKKKGGWLATVKYKGQRQRKQLRTRAMAEIWARDTLDRIKLRKPFVDDSVTVAQAVDKYMREIAPLQADTGRTRRISNGETIKALIGKSRIYDLTPEVISERYCLPRLTLVCSSTVRRELSLLSQCLHHSGLKQNPVQDVRQSLFRQRKLTAPARRDRRLSSAELIRLLRACPIPLRYLVWLTVQTGLRRSELCGLESSKINNKKLLIEKSKTGKTRHVPLSLSSQRTLKRLTEKNLTKSPYAPRTISKYFKEACDKAGIDDFHFHDLRAEAAHRMLEGRIYKRKCTIDEVAQILGNSVRVLEAHYANHYRFTDLV